MNVILLSSDFSNGEEGSRLNLVLPSQQFQASFKYDKSHARLANTKCTEKLYQKNYHVIVKRSDDRPLQYQIIFPINLHSTYTVLMNTILLILCSVKTNYMTNLGLVHSYSQYYVDIYFTLSVGDTKRELSGA